MRTILLLPLALLAACASLPAADPATLDCPALASEIQRTQQQLQDARATRYSPIQINIGLGGAIGQHGAAGIGIGVPVGSPVTDSERITRLEQRLALLQHQQQQRPCPSPTKP